MTADEVLSRIEKAAELKGLPIIGPAKGRLFDAAVSQAAPRSALEVGTLVGYSAIRIARALHPGGKLTCVEINSEIARTARSNLASAGLADRVTVLVGDAKEVLPTLKGPLDFVFLDARKDEYLAYLRACEARLHEGSVVVADNVGIFAEEVAGYLDYVRGSGKYKSRTVEAPLGGDPRVTDAMEISVRL